MVVLAPDERELALALADADGARRALSVPDEPVAGSLAAAYEMARLGVADRISRGSGPVRGYKVSVTSEHFQRIVGVDHPILGRLTADRIRLHPARLSRTALLEPLLEPELVFEVLARIPPDASRAAILARTRRRAGLEIPDSRFGNWYQRVGATALTADNAVAGILVVGRYLPEDLDPSEVRVLVRSGGRTIARGSTDEVMGGDPVRSVQWLAGALEDQGQWLQPGDLVASGTLSAPLRLGLGVTTGLFAGPSADVPLSAAARVSLLVT